MFRFTESEYFRQQLTSNGYQFEFLVTLPLHFSLHDKYMNVPFDNTETKSEKWFNALQLSAISFEKCTLDERESCEVEKKAANKWHRVSLPKVSVILLQRKERKTVKR